MLKNWTEYVTFVEKSQLIRQDFLTVDLQMLEEIAIHYRDRNALLITDIINWNWIASPATLHSRLKRLVRNQLIHRVADNDDGRKRYIEPTEKGLQILTKLANCM